jgi:dipeptidyl aminopeptidase/acylaminoacyl peptidase
MRNSPVIRNLLRAAGIASLLALAARAQAQAPPKRALTLDDLHRFKEVSDPQLSPEGAWVAYTVTSANLDEDQRGSDVWMSSWDGAQRVRLTWSTESEHTPRWSPDGRYLAFLSGRGDDHESDQLWLLNRTGGEAERLTRFPGGVEEYAWSPDGRRLALVVQDPDPDDLAPGQDSARKKKTPKPIVVDRFQFKADYQGYLGGRRRHLYLLDLEARKTEQLTSGAYEERMPEWSPDGRSIAFVTKRVGDVDRNDNWDIYVIDARAGATPRQLTTFAGADADPSWGSAPAWSPDGRWIGYLEGGPDSLIYYAVHKLAVIPATGGQRRLLTADLDRNVGQPTWSADGAALLFLLEDDRNSHLARVPSAGGRVERLFAGRRVVSALSLARSGKIAVLSSTPTTPDEVFAIDAPARVKSIPAAAARALARQNDSLLAVVELASTDEIEFQSKDGTRIAGLLVKPADYQPGRSYPAILRVHGGPVSQEGNAWDFDWQLFAAHGYVVIASNPRGSSGRGEKFSTAIYADWGNKDTQDILAAVDHVVAQKIADPNRLGIGGWSYGGILTNYTIAQDTRFKAAISGAGISNVLAGYGTDQYIREYEAELGAPWVKPETWIKLSSPFLHADRIVTPTLFMCGEKDFNVPLLNSEQMYQALRSLGRDTQLVIYPGQHHGITKPSYQRDRLARYLAWYDKYLMAGAVGAGR